MQDFLIKALEEQDTLCHHGILGQKWGVRRYQNPDGSLTDEGRKRYGKPLSTKIMKAEKKMDPYEVNRLANDKNLLKAAKKNTLLELTKKDLQDSKKVYDEETERLNKAIWERAQREIRNDPSIPQDEIYVRTMLKGAELAQTMFREDKDFMKARDQYERFSKDYEKQSHDFVKDFLGDYGNEPSPNPLSVKFDTKTGKVSPQTLTDKLAFEMYRNAGGLIDDD